MTNLDPAALAPKDTLGTTRHRTLFVGPGDLMFSYELANACAFLSSQVVLEANDINDIIEARQSYRLIDAAKGMLDLPSDEIEALVNRARVANNSAMKEFRKCVDSSPFEEILNGIQEPFYRDALIEMIGATKAVAAIGAERLFEEIEKGKLSVALIIKHKEVARQLEKEIKGYLLKHPKTGAEMVIDSFAVNERGKVFLPKLTDEEMDWLLLQYCECDAPHPDRLAIIARWQKGYGGSITPLTRAAAAKRLRELNAQFKDSGLLHTFKQAVEMAISYDQIACRRVDSNEGCMSFTFSQKWLEDTLDEPAILTNLIYVFEVIDRFGDIVAALPAGTGTSIVETFGVHAKDARPQNLGTTFQQMVADGVVNLYEQFLLAHGTSLERCAEWFFNEYIRDEYGIEGFRCDMPSPEMSALDKCRIIYPELERVAKEYHLFAKYGEIDLDLFEFESHPPFDGIKSLDEHKYAYGKGDMYEAAAFHLFSDQSPLSFPGGDRKDTNSFFELVVTNKVGRSDFDSYLDGVISWLEEHGFITIDGESISITPRGYLVVTLKSRGSVWLRMCDKEMLHALEELEDEGMVFTEDTLLSRQESGLFNFILAARGYSNSMGVRNRYAHGAPPLSDPDCEEYQRDYSRMLFLMICLVEKMNDELRLCKEKSPEIEVVDWPLVDEDAGGTD